MKKKTGKGKLLARGCFKVHGQAAAKYGNKVTELMIDLLKKDVADVPYNKIEIEMARVADGFVFNWELRE